MITACQLSADNSITEEVRETKHAAEKQRRRLVEKLRDLESSQRTRS